MNDISEVPTGTPVPVRKRGAQPDRKPTITPAQRRAIRVFRDKYPFISQADLAKLFICSPARMSEIVRGVHSKGGF